ncbi:MAG TPA: hypothetical protein VHO25_05135, partial [Polyangiaceae bacterium]|nr:hypothetical protein [Polyangiaceae bacterium]
AALGLATVSSSVGKASWPAWLQTGLVLTALGGVAATLAFFGLGSEPQVTAQQPAAPVAEPRPALAAPPPSTVEAPGAPVMQATDLPVEPAVDVPAGVKASNGDKAVPEAPVAEPSLAAELDAIRPAKTRLAAGDAAGALAQVRQYRSQFPKGRLAVEATVIEVEALVALGQRSAAEKRAAPLLKGDSPYAARLRTLLGANSAQKP